MEFLELDRSIIKKCRRFEIQWEKGSDRPRLEDYLPEVPKESDPLFENLLASELELRTAAGETPERNEYTSRFPQAKDTVQRIFAQLEDEGTAAPPSQLGDFRIVQRIGRGATSIVYEAIQISLNRKVALKLLVGNPFLSSGHRRLNNEARAVALLNHPQIVTLHGIGNDQGYSYLVMQLVQGSTLDRLLNPSTSTTPPLLQELSQAINNPRHSRRQIVIVELVEKIARALSYAHRNGILHRDVKPSNILVSDQGEVLLTDFGLASLKGGETGWSATSTIVGTPQYLPPEVFDGTWTESADVFALGVTLHQLLTGYKPETTDTRWGYRSKSKGARIPRPRSLATGIDRDLETIVVQATQTEQTKRYQSAREFADDLGAYLRREPIAARRARLLRQFLLWIRREPLVAGLAISLFLTLLIGITHAEFQFRRSQRANKELQHRSREHYLESWDRATQDNDMSASLLWLLAASTSKSTGPDQGQILSEEDSLRFYNTLNRIPSLEHFWSATTTTRLPPRFIPNSNWLLTTGPDGEMVIRDVNKGTILSKAMEVDGPAKVIAISADGRFVATTTGTSRGDVTVFALPDGNRVYHNAVRPSWVHGLDFSPDSSQLAFNREDEIVVLNTDTWEERGPRIKTKTVESVKFTLDGGAIQQVDRRFSLDQNHWGALTQLTLLSPKKNSPWIISQDAGVTVYASENAIHVAPHEDTVRNGTSLSHARWHRIERPTTSSDSVNRDTVIRLISDPFHEFAAAATANGAVILIDMKNRRQIGEAFFHADEAVDIAFSPSGAYLATASRDGTVSLLKIPSMQPFGPTLRHESALTGVDFSPRGDRLATSTREGITRVWNLRRIDSHRGPQESNISRVSWNPGHSTIAVANRFGEIEIRPLSGSNQPTMRLDAGGALLQMVRSSDSKIVASLNEDNRPRVWSLPNKTPIFESATADPFDLVLSPSGDWLARMHSVNFDLIDLTIQQELISAGQIRWMGNRHPSRQGIFFDEDQQKILLCHPDRALRSISLKDGEALKSQERGPEQISSLALDPNRQNGVVAYRGADVRRFEFSDLMGGTKLLKDSDIVAMEYSPNGEYLAMGDSQGEVYVISERQSETTIKKLYHGSGLDGLTFISLNATNGISGDHLLVTWDIEGRIRAWDPTRTTPLSPFIHMEAPIRSLQPSHQNGTILVVTEQDIFETIDLTPRRPPSSKTSFQSLAHLYAAHRLEAGDDFSALTSQSLSELWETTRPSVIERPKESSAEINQWHWQELQKAQRTKRWNSILFHSEAILNAAPNNKRALEFRAIARLQAGLSIQAANDFRNLDSSSWVTSVQLNHALFAAGQDLELNHRSVTNAPVSHDIKALLHALIGFLAHDKATTQSQLKRAIDTSPILDVTQRSDLKYRFFRAPAQDRPLWEAMRSFLLKVNQRFPHAPFPRICLALAHANCGEWTSANDLLSDLTLTSSPYQFAGSLILRCRYEAAGTGTIPSAITSGFEPRTTSDFVLTGDAYVRQSEWLAATEMFQRAIRMADKEPERAENVYQASKASLSWPIGYGRHDSETINRIKQAISDLAL